MNKLRWAIPAVLVSLALPAAADAKQYVLKHPKHEHCRAHYVKRVEKIKIRGRKIKETVCVHRISAPIAPMPAPIEPTPAPMPAPIPPPTVPALASTITVISAAGTSLPGEPYFFSVSGSISILGGTDLIGTPITYTLTNKSTGQALASFTEPSNPPQPCAIVYTVEANTQTFKGEAITFPAQSACPLGTVSMPTGQIPVLTGSFAGNSIDSPSTSEQKVL